MNIASVRTASALLAVLCLLAAPFGAAMQPAAQSLSGQLAAQSGWMLASSPTDATMHTMDMTGPSYGWSGGMAGFLFRYTGTEWVSVPTPFQCVITGMDLVDETWGWAVSDCGEFLFFNGAAWQVHSTLPDDPTSQKMVLSDVQMIGKTDGWAVGASLDGASALVYRYDVRSDSWQYVSNSCAYGLAAIDMVDASDGWAVGGGGTILHWNGSHWSGGSIERGIILTDVDMVSSADGWAVGTGGRIYHYDGTVWSMAPSPVTADLQAVYMIDGEEGWAVGGQGTILHYKGNEWQAVASPTTKKLLTVHMVDEAEGWAMGNYGVILHYLGGSDLSPSFKAVTPSHAAAGERLTYTIGVKNSGAGSASSVVVTDAMPSGTEYVAGSATTTQGSISGPDPLVVAVGDIPPGGQVTITFQVDVMDLGLECWFIPNQALIDEQGTQLARQATAAIGDCSAVFLPLVHRETP